jgi:hypothetical protein
LYGGKVSFKKTQNAIDIVCFHPAVEVRNVAQRFANFMLKELKHKNFVTDDASSVEIQFGNFNNKDWLRFLFGLTNDDSVGMFRFKRLQT